MSREFTFSFSFGFTVFNHIKTPGTHNQSERQCSRPYAVSGEGQAIGHDGGRIKKMMNSDIKINQHFNQHFNQQKDPKTL
jgi:hypothetical protein